MCIPILTVYKLLYSPSITTQLFICDLVTAEINIFTGASYNRSRCKRWTVEHIQKILPLNNKLYIEITVFYPFNYTVTKA